ncbi:GNAT family N-acetyltransferase [Aliiglaciecola litoralis]|uniref:N-acetyltransferase domain-containing protein n=1 Tax=Aliiglaciecola litoralis TaxID=582857 RepID=A0ABP3WTJ7_9ALTE
MDPNSIPITLTKAAAGDTPQLHTWFDNLHDIQYWGGPSMDYPISLCSFSEKLKMDSLASFKLAQGTQPLLAFGQAYLRAKRIHFCRLAVSPSHRGKGLGRTLVNSLMQHAPNHVDGNGYSLFVMADNEIAIKLYQSLGFHLAQYPETLSEGLAQYLYMVRDPL